MKKLTLSLAAAMVLAAPTAFAQGREFGDQGTLAFDAATGGNIGYTSTSPAGGGSSFNTIDINVQPAMHYFVTNGFSVGGTLLFDWSKPSTTDATTTIGIGPTVGYNIWLTPGQLSLWPKVTFSFENASKPGSGSGATATPSGSAQLMNLGVYVPLLIHPVKHFHIGVGPYFGIDLSNKFSAGSLSVDGDKSTSFGVKADIGGWTWLGD
jgi:hypothetical protein